MEEDSDSGSDDDLSEYDKVVGPLALKVHQAEKDGKNYEATPLELEYAQFVEPDVDEEVLASYKKWRTSNM